jgi:hypothetical protein
MKVVMICAPAKSGKDTLLPILKKSLIKKYGGRWDRFAFADKLKQDLEEEIKDQYGVSVWDDSKKHLFRESLIKYGEQKRNETNNMFLIDNFFATLRKYPTRNFIISDHRFINEYEQIIKYLARNTKGVHEVIPIYIERVFNKNGLKFVTQPSIPQEVTNYPDIKNISKVYQIPWESGIFWRSKLNKYEFKL